MDVVFLPQCFVYQTNMSGIYSHVKSFVLEIIFNIKSTKKK